MTPTSVGLVLVEGRHAGGATVKSHSFPVRYGVIKTSEQAAEAVRRTEALASSRGLHLRSVGVTWSEDADAEAALLMETLSTNGFDDVVPIRMPAATESLARGMAAVTGYDTTAVCVIEPDTVITVIVHSGDDAVQTAVNHAIDSDDSLIAWLSAMFPRADWQPEALVLVGSAGGFESVAPRLEDALGVSVFAPEESKLALAKGAAMASARNATGPHAAGSEFAAASARPFGRPTRGRFNLLSVGATSLLVLGVLTFVVSVAVAIGLEFAPHRDAAPAKPVAAAADVPQAPAKPAALPPPVVRPPAPAAAPPPAAAPIVEAPPADGFPIIEGLPPVLGDDPSLFRVPDALEMPAPIFDAPPRLPGPPPGYDFGEPTTPPKKPGIIDRIRERLNRMGDQG